MPTKEVATKDDGPKLLTVMKAKNITEKLKEADQDLYNLLKEAYEGRVWVALGYKDWDTYLDAELGDVPLRLPRENRRKQSYPSVVGGGQHAPSPRWSVPVSGRSTATSRKLLLFQMEQ